MRDYEISFYISDNLEVKNLQKLEYFSIKKERKESKIDQDLYVTLLWFKFFHEWKLKQLGWKSWEPDKRFNLKLAHHYNREQVKEYLLSINYENWWLSKISILVEGIDFTKSWQKIVAWLDISPWFKDNFTREYEYDKIINKLVLKKMYRWATSFDVEEIRTNQKKDTLEKQGSNYFIMPEEITAWEDWSFKISDMQNHFDIISIPNKIN